MEWIGPSEQQLSIFCTIDLASHSNHVKLFGWHSQSCLILLLNKPQIQENNSRERAHPTGSSCLAFQHALCVVIRDESMTLWLAQVDFHIWLWTRIMERTETQRIIFVMQVVFLLVERGNEASGNRGSTHYAGNHVGPANTCRCLWS